MILNRLGNKKKLAKKIQSYFPQHNCYIEPFFGAGGMFFYKHKSKFNIVNDLDDDIFNLFQVVIHEDKCEKLKELFLTMPYSESLFKYWVKFNEDNQVKKALRFLFLSNYSFMGTMNTLQVSTSSTKRISTFLSRLKQTQDKLQNVQFLHGDFRKFFKKISFKNKNSFIYCDPPYINTMDNYSSSFKLNDFIDLLDLLINTKQQFAISEFKNDVILNECDKHNLNVIEIQTRIALNRINTDILITNYKTQQQFNLL